MATAALDPITLPVAEEQQLLELQAMLKRGNALLVAKGGGPTLELPETVYALLLQILDQMQKGNAISIVPIHQDLTTQQAAEMLGVSRPFFVKLLETGNLPFHLAGTHRRVYLRDLLAFKHLRDQERHEALDRIGEAMEKAGIYDKVLLPDA